MVVECDWTVLCWESGREELEAELNDQHLRPGALRAGGGWGRGRGRRAAGSAWLRTAPAALWAGAGGGWTGRWG